MGIRHAPSLPSELKVSYGSHVTVQHVPQPRADLIFFSKAPAEVPIWAQGKHNLTAPWRLVCFGVAVLDHPFGDLILSGGMLGTSLLLQAMSLWPRSSPLPAQPFF